MALEDTITNLGTAIINLINAKITKHSSEIEETLLELKAKIDALVENSGSTAGEDEPIATSVNPNAFDNYDTNSGYSYIYWVNSTFEGTQEDLKNIFENGEPVSNAAEPGSSFDNLTLMYSYYDAAHTSINYQSISSDMVSPNITYTVTDDKVYMTDGELTYWRYGTSTTPELDAYNEANKGDSDDTEDAETVTIDGYTAKVTTKTTSDETGDAIFWTTYTFTAPIHAATILVTCVDSEGDPKQGVKNVICKSSVDGEDNDSLWTYDPEFGMIEICDFDDVYVQVISIGSEDGKVTITQMDVDPAS